MTLRSLDLFSCIGCHAAGMHAAGLRTVGFCESDPWRRGILAERFPGVPIADDVRTIDPPAADLAFGGPPCQQTSVAAAIHGKRTGQSLWPYMLAAANRAGAEWVVVEQPPGNAAWESEVFADLRRSGRHVARVEYGARDVGAPYLRRRVYVIACASLPRLALAWRAVPCSIKHVARAANAGGTWDAGKLRALRVDARAAGEMERSASALRKQRIEALGDSNPPAMAEVIGRAILAAMAESGAAIKASARR